MRIERMQGESADKVLCDGTHVKRGQLNLGPVNLEPILGLEALKKKG